MESLCNAERESAYKLVVEVAILKRNGDKVSDLESYLIELQNERNKIDGFRENLPLVTVLLQSVIREVKKLIMQSENISPDKIVNLNLPLFHNYEMSNLFKEEKKREVLKAIGEDSAETTESVVGCESTLFSTTNDESDSKNGQQKSCRKKRRRWSVDLHQHFIQTLDLIGGPAVATPKLILEHMKINGLTNDEVRSHLQKYRKYLRQNPSEADYFEFPKHKNARSNSPRPPEVDDARASISTLNNP